MTALITAISPSSTRRRRDAASCSSRRRSLIAACRVCGVETSYVSISARDLDQEGARCRAGRSCIESENRSVGSPSSDPRSARRRGGGRSGEPDTPARQSLLPQRSRLSFPHPDRMRRGYPPRDLERCVADITVDTVVTSGSSRSAREGCPSAAAGPPGPLRHSARRPDDHASRRRCAGSAAAGPRAGSPASPPPAGCVAFSGRMAISIRCSPITWKQ